MNELSLLFEGSELAAEKLRYEPLFPYFKGRSPYSYHTAWRLPRPLKIGVLFR